MLNLDVKKKYGGDFRIGGLHTQIECLGRSVNEPANTKGKKNGS
jgi:hypothetical protein